MKNKIIATAIILPLLGISSMVSADFDCTTIDRDTIKEIMDKNRSWETLTTSEQEILDNAKTCRPEGKWEKRTGNKEWKWERPDMTDEQKVEREEMKNKKAVNKVKKQKRVVKSLSTKTKTSINWAINKVSKAYARLSDEQKLDKYEKLQEKLEDKLETILDNTTYSDAKKELFESIINQLLNQLDDEIESLN